MWARGSESDNVCVDVNCGSAMRIEHEWVQSVVRWMVVYESESGDETGGRKATEICNHCIIYTVSNSKVVRLLSAHRPPGGATVKMFGKPRSSITTPRASGIQASYVSYNP